MLSSRDLPDPGIKPTSFTSPVLAGRFFTTSATWANVVQSLSHVQLFVTPWTAAQETSLSFTISQSLLKLMSVELVMDREAQHSVVHGVTKSWT